MSHSVSTGVVIILWEEQSPFITLRELDYSDVGHMLVMVPHSA